MFPGRQQWRSMSWYSLSLTGSGCGPRGALPGVYRIWGLSLAYSLWLAVIVIGSGLCWRALWSIGWVERASSLAALRQERVGEVASLPTDVILDAQVAWLVGGVGLGGGKGRLVFEKGVNEEEGAALAIVPATVGIGRVGGVLPGQTVGLRRLSLLWSTWAQLASLSTAMGPYQQWQPTTTAQVAHVLGSLRSAQGGGVVFFRNGLGQGRVADSSTFLSRGRVGQTLPAVVSTEGQPSLVGVGMAYGLPLPEVGIKWEQGDDKLHDVRVQCC